MFPDYGFFYLYCDKPYVLEGVVSKFRNIIDPLPDGYDNPERFSINFAGTLEFNENQSPNPIPYPPTEAAG